LHPLAERGATWVGGEGSISWIVAVETGNKEVSTKKTFFGSPKIMPQ